MKRVALAAVFVALQVSQTFGQIVFSTYLGGNADNDWGKSVAVDSQGCTYVTGYTASTNFIRTIEVPVGTTNGAYVVKLAQDGSLLYATMIYGAQDSRGIAVDTNGCAYITGVTTATNFPTTPGVFQPNRSSVSIEAFAAKLGPDGNLVYATYLGGAGSDYGNAITVDSQGYAYVAGMTRSTNFPVTSGAYQTSLSSQVDVWDNFITKLASDGSAVYSTYADIGEPYGIAVDASSNAYITGRTDGTIPDVGAIQPAYGGGTYDAYIIRLNASGSDVSYATYFGGSGRDEGRGIYVDPDENMYIAGKTESSNLRVTNAFQPTMGFGSDAFFAKFDRTGTNLFFSSFLGGKYDEEGCGISVDSNRNVYIAGWVTSTNFPVTNAIQAEKAGPFYKPDAFVTQFAADGSNLIYSTYWGGDQTEYCYDMALRPDGAVSIVGVSESTNFPVYAAIQPGYAGGYRDAFVACILPGEIPEPVSPPSKATSPTPGDGLTGQDRNVDVSWANGGGATSYDVYFGEDSSPDSGELKGNQSGRSYNPGTLAYGTTYYWRVDAKNSLGTTTGDVWSFTIQPTPVTLTISPSSRGHTSAAATAQEIDVSANVSWTATESLSWITVTGGSSGSNNGTVTYSVAANSASTSRSGSITVSGSGITRTFTVNQEAVPSSLTISPSSRDHTSAAVSAQEIDVSANVSWAVAESLTWVTITGGATGSGNDTVTYSVAQNSETIERFGIITVTGGGLTRSFTVNQEAAPSSLTISPSSRDHTSAAVSAQEIDISANVSWAVTESLGWVTITGGATGSGNDTVTYSVAQNSETIERSGTIMVSGGGITRNFTVSQAPAPVDRNNLPHFSDNQFLNFSANGSSFWAMIWDYTHVWRESSTPGVVTTDETLNYTISEYLEIHVGYLYDWATGRYIEAQALRNILL